MCIIFVACRVFWAYNFYMKTYKNQKIVLAACSTLAIIALFAAGCVSSGKGLSSNLAQGEKDLAPSKKYEPQKGADSSRIKQIKSVEEIQLGDNEFLVSLAENPSTGYGWQYTISNPELVSVSKDYFEYDNSAEPRVVGRGGMRHIVFCCKKDGKSSIDLVYCRSWEGGEVAERRVVNVEYANDDALFWSMEKVDFYE